MTTRLIFALALAVAPVFFAAPALCQPPATAPAKAADVDLTPRFAPGQVALYEVATSDSKHSPDFVRRTARLEVLRITGEGAVLRWTDYWEGKDKSVRPEPMGESHKRTAEFTVDVLVPHSGDDATAADVEPARAELIGRYTAEQRARGKSGAALTNAVSDYRRVLAADTMVHNILVSDFGLLFNGLNHTLPAGFRKSLSDELSMDPAMPALKRSVTFTLKTDDTGARHTLRQKWSVSGEQLRPWMRTYLRRTLKTPGGEPTDSQLTEMVKDMKGLNGENSTIYDSASGWPAALSLDKQSTDGPKVRRQTSHITLIEGPDPVVPPPPGPESDEYARWLVALVAADRAPLRWYGRREEESIERVTPSQREILLQAAVAPHAAVNGEPAAATVFAGAATYDMPEEGSPAVVSAYPHLPAEARAAVLENTLRIGEPWSLALFGRLLAMSPDEKSLSRLPLGDIEDAPELSNAALKASLEHTRAGSFDWPVLYTAYELVEGGKLDAALRSAAFKRAAEVLALSLARAEPKQKPAHGQWVYAEDYGNDRDTVSLAADLLGHAQGDAGLTELGRALRLTDQRPRAFAAGALARRGEKLDAAVIDSVCASPVGLSVLIPQLRAAGRLELVPASAATLEAAATADLVNWLTHPSEIGREPEEIVLLKAVDITAESGEEPSKGATGTERYFVFKFRSDLEAFKAKGWLIGLSGPWSPNSPFSQPPGEHTFSAFEPVGTKTPEEHARSIIDLLTKAARERAARTAPTAPPAPAPAPPR